MTPREDYDPEPFEVEDEHGELEEDYEPASFESEDKLNFF